MTVLTMKPNATVRDIGAVIQAIEAMGLKPHMQRLEGVTQIGIVGATPENYLKQLSELTGVECLNAVDTPYKLVSRNFRKQSSEVKVDGVLFGGKEIVVIAGPCAVESSAQINIIAAEVAAAGAAMVRGGAFKPRTSPYSFRGLGHQALEYLTEARRQTGRPFVTEVLSPSEVDLVAKSANMLQVGSRNMQNYSLLEAVGKANKPVLLKRGLMSTVEELLLAAEYIVAAGNSNVVLCERGIRSFEQYTRNTLDINAVPLLKQLTHLPVIVDPSHATGRRDLVIPVALAAVAAGADGLIVEVHHDPDNALSDGEQSLDLEQFRKLMEGLRGICVPLNRAIRK